MALLDLCRSIYKVIISSQNRRHFIKQFLLQQNSRNVTKFKGYNRKIGSRFVLKCAIHASGKGFFSLVRIPDNDDKSFASLLSLVLVILLKLVPGGLWKCWKKDRWLEQAHNHQTVHASGSLEVETYFRRPNERALILRNYAFLAKTT